MQIYYLRYADDDPTEDGIWLFCDELQFYLRKEQAEAECERRNAEQRATWDEAVKRSLSVWEKIEVAYQSLTDLGLEPSEVFPYHKRTFTSMTFKPYFVVDEIQVDE